MYTHDEQMARHSARQQRKNIVAALMREFSVRDSATVGSYLTHQPDDQLRATMVSLTKHHQSLFYRGKQ
jgi:hypothetical protein